MWMCCCIHCLAVKLVMLYQSREVVISCGAHAGPNKQLGLLRESVCVWYWSREYALSSSSSLPSSLLLAAWLIRPWVAVAWASLGPGLAQVVGAPALWAKNPECQWYKALWKLCGAVYRERTPDRASKYSHQAIHILSLAPAPTLTSQHADTSSSRIQYDCDDRTTLLLQTSPAPGRCNGPDLMRPQQSSWNL